MRITLGKQDDCCTICGQNLTAIDVDHHGDVGGPALVIRCDTCEFDWAVVRLVESLGYAVTLGYSRPLGDVLTSGGARGWRTPPGEPAGP